VSERGDYPIGVPCWVDTLQPDPFITIRFYESLFGWKFISGGKIRQEPPGDYYVAQLRGRDVAGVGPLLRKAAGLQPNWTTHIRVESANATLAAAIAAGGKALIEPFDLTPAGRMALLADPTGATFAVWKPKHRRGAQVINEAGAWALSTLNTNDLRASQEFYGSVFGWKAEVLSGGQLTIFRLPGYFGGEPTQPVPRDVVAIMQSVNPGQHPQWGVDFWIDDVDLVSERAAELGGVVVLEPRDSGSFRYAVLEDSQGAVFTVSKMRAQSS